eukprot:TRINITY_DN3514_c0_g1_i2.p1 TRINITY_DN3514_c0_g1~~TRINITY_DN3514_c0_g1_i2.p1  ORF type:complete len:230 (-),score=84.51 TRINITY_DN3514_c0_g1_i2:318-1007(-)
MAFKEVTSTFYIHLSPACLPDPTDAITRELGTLVLTYHENLGGVVLALRNLRVSSAPTRVLFDSPYLHLHVTADVLLFAPQIGMQLSGKVNFVGATHIGLLLQGVVNVSVMAEKIPELMEFDEDEEGEGFWFEEGKEDDRVVMDSVLSFFVTKVNVRNGDISLQGSLLPEDSVPEEDLAEDVAVTPAKKKKKEKKEKKSEKKSSKKRKNTSEEEEDKPKAKSSKKLKKK